MLPGLCEVMTRSLCGIICLLSYTSSLCCKYLCEVLTVSLFCRV